MGSARHFSGTVAGADPARRPRIFAAKKAGIPTQAEKALVAQFVADQTCDVTPPQERALSRLLRRSPEATRKLIEEAKEQFVAAAPHYVTVHRQAVDMALANGDPKSLDVAVRGSQWALESMGDDTVRIVDKQKAAATSGSKILIGVAVGGVDQPVASITLPALTKHD